MIVDLILGIFQGIVNILLAPLQILSFGVDVASSISVVQGFVKVVAYLFPWSHLSPIIAFVIGMFIFRSIVALIKIIWELLPIL